MGRLSEEVERVTGAGLTRQLEFQEIVSDLEEMKIKRDPMIQLS